MVFGNIIGKVGFSGFPMDIELALSYTVPDPVETHVDGAGAVLLDGVVGDAASGGIVSLDWCGRLGVAHVGKSTTEDDTFFDGNEEAAVFGFGGRASDVFEDADDVEDGAIVDFEAVGAIAEVEVATNAAASFGNVEIASISVDFEEHVAGIEAESGVGKGRTIIEELENILLGKDGGVGLGRGNGTEGDEESRAVRVFGERCCHR